MKFIKTLLLFFILSSCFKDDVKKVEIEVYRFDKELSSVDSTNIDAKIDKWDTILNGFHHFYYSSFLDLKYENSDSLKSLILQGIYHEELSLITKEISNKFPDFTKINTEIESAFGLVQFYFPNFIVPKNIVIINGERTYAMMFKGDTVVLSLDMYLGDSNIVYDSAPLYIRKMFQEKYIIPDILENWCNVQFETNPQSNFLDKLIYKGKIMYLMSQFLPHKNIETILRFSKSEFEECEESESIIWDGIISLDLLYSNYEREYHSFFNIDVCTRPISPDSPSRLGYYTGYKIIQNYMQNTDVSLLELMQNTNSQQILLNSKYKPKHD